MRNDCLLFLFVISLLFVYLLLRLSTLICGARIEKNIYYSLLKVRF